MKNLFLLLFLGSITGLYAQNIYVPGETIKGKTVTYRCQAETSFFLKMIDVDDVSAICTDNFPLYGSFDDKALLELFREELTDEEWESIKGKVGYGLISRFMIDAHGEIHDWVFLFRTDDPVLSKFEPDRLYELERKFKGILIQVLNESGKPTKNIKCSLHIFYHNIF